MQTPDPTQVGAAAAALGELEHTATGSQDVTDATRFSEIQARSDMTARERQANIESAILVLAEANARFATTFDDKARASGLTLFGQLVNNQPQVSLTAGYVFRDALFGARQQIYRATYERGLGNSLNAFLDRAGDRCDDAASAECAAAYKKFATQPSTKAAIKSGSRLALFATVTVNDAYAYQNADQHIDLSFGTFKKVGAGLDYGRLIGVDDDGTASVRVDGSIQYDWSSNQKFGKNNMVATLTLTKKIGGVSVPFGIRYAQRTDFLSDFNHGVSAHVGLKFDLFPAFK
jgi:hypothetical protein